MEFKRVADALVSVWAAEIDVERYAYQPPISAVELLMSFDLVERWPDFRGVSYDRLPTILETGIDVRPTTAPIFVDDFEKAWKYGGWPKVIMALDAERLERTYREIAAGTPADEVSRLLQDYPRRLESEDGEFIWLTRLPASDTRATTAYERYYARWIPGNPMDALIAVFLFMPENQTG